MQKRKEAHALLEYFNPNDKLGLRSDALQHRSLKKIYYDIYLILPNNIPHYTLNNIVYALFRSIQVMFVQYAQSLFLIILWSY